MRELKLGICFIDDDGEVMSKRVIGTSWTVDLEKDINENFNIHVVDEIAAILTENLKLQLTTEVVKEMLEEVKERSNK